MKRQNRVAMFNILSTVLLNCIPLITGPVFSRLLGDSGYGIAKIYNIWVSVTAILFTLQTHNTLVNAIVEFGEEEQKSYHSAVMGLSISAFLVFGALVLVFLEPISLFLNLESRMICLMLLQAFGTFCVNFLNTRNTYEFKAGKNMGLSLTVTILNFVLSLIFVLSMEQQERYFGRTAGTALTYAVIGIPACIQILRRGRVFYNRDYWKFCIVLAIPSVFHGLSDLILGQSDMLMVRYFLGDAKAGHYGYAWQFGNMLFIIFTALNRTWCPFFFEEMKQGKQDAMLQKSRNFLELFTILACGFILLTPEVFHVYARKDYWSGTMVVPLFVTSYYINFLCTFPVNFEYYHKKTKVVAAVTIGSSLLNVALNFIWIQTIGMVGAAVATVVSHLVQLVLHHMYCRKLGAGKYPFPMGFWVKYAFGYAVILLVVYLTQDLGLLRWGIGAALGVFELLRLRKRRVII